MYKFKNIIILLSFYSFIFPNIIESGLLSNDSYITGDDGVVRMYINVLGHVKNPGTYVVYDGIDFLTVLSMAGGYLKGSDLKKIMLYHTDGAIEKINLKQILANNEKSIKSINLKPHDTIYIEETNWSKFIYSSNIPSIILGVLNIALTLERTK